MKRRNFIKKAGLAAIASTGVIAACQREETQKSAPAVQTRKKYEWKMVTTWPKNFPGLGTGANFLAKIITDMSDGELTVKVYGGGELVPPFESFDAVSKNTAQMGHGAAYYWKGKSPATQFFAAVPFGLNALETNAWIYYGGGQQLWDEVYASFNLKPFLAGNTGVQMGGWFNKEINSLEDMKGLKMRMPGLGADVINQVGAIAVSLPGGEIFPSLESGAIDATEWVGPYNDLAFGFYKITKFYYGPGWHEPGTALECFVNKTAYDALPAHLQKIVEQACKAANQDMYAEFIAKNNIALSELLNKHSVQLRKFPDEVIKQLGNISKDVVASVADSDPLTKKVYEAFVSFRKEAITWSRIGEEGYTYARNLVF